MERVRAFKHTPEPTLPSIEQEGQEKQLLKNVLSEIIGTLSMERLRELANDIRIFERAILGIEPDKDKLNGTRSILSGGFTNPESARTNAISKLTQIAGGIVNTIPAPQASVLLQDIPGLFSFIKYGVYMGERSQTNQLPPGDEKTVLEIISKINL
jgi:hypothetical protein